MAVTGVALVLFLTFHACTNMVALFSAEGYNAICEFLGANWYAVVATAVLAVLVLMHFGLASHLYNFWAKMMFAELSGAADADMATNGIYHIVNTFHGIGGHTVSGYVYTALYLVWLAALWFHLNHGIWSAMQSMGMNSKIWFPRLKAISTVYSTVLILMFAAVAVLFCLGYTPSDCTL